MKVSTTTSIFWEIVVSIILGVIISRIFGFDIMIGTTGLAIIFLGILQKISVKIPEGQTGVLKIFGERKKTTFGEGWHVQIPFSEIVVVDTRELIEKIPDPIKEKKEYFDFMTGVKCAGANQAKLLSRIVLKYRVTNPTECLGYNPYTVRESLRNKCVNEVREHGAKMSADDFIAEKATIAGQIKRAVDGMYNFIEVIDVDIAKAAYANEELEKEEQAKRLQTARTGAQAADLLGTGGTVDRITTTAQRLITSGMSPEEAWKIAPDLVQTQEGRLTIDKKVYGGFEPLATILAALLKGGKP